MIYFIQDGDDGPIKIGYSDNVLRRIRDLRTGTHQNLRLLLAIGGGVEQEAQLHERFSFAHKKGEWFWPVNALIDFVDGYTLPPVELAPVEPPPITKPPTHLKPRRLSCRRGDPQRQLDEQRICQLYDEGMNYRAIYTEIYGQPYTGGRQVATMREILKKSGRIK